MRIVVVGTSGAGKTMLARRIAAQLQLPHIELDAINWQSEWRDLTRHDPEEFVRRVRIQPCGTSKDLCPVRAPDSPLEEDGFEPSVPLGREVLKGRTSR